MVDTVTTNELNNSQINPTPFPLTTGASPVTVDIDVRAYAITTGGTAGSEVINLPNPTLDINAEYNFAYIGQRVIFYLAVQTNPADVVKITAAGNDEVISFGRQENPFWTRTHTVDGVRLDTVGQAAVLIWSGDKWQHERSMNGGNDASTHISNNFQVNVATGKALTIALFDGSLSFSGLPTADPLNSGDVWNNAGTLKISAG